MKGSGSDMKIKMAFLYVMTAVAGFCAPIASSVGGKHISFNGKEEEGISAKSYVQEGLSIQFDGIENVSYGNHDASTTWWYELITRQYKWQIYHAYDDCVSFQSSQIMQHLTGGNASLRADSDLTIHAVVTAPSSISWAVRAMPNLGRDSFGINGFCLGGVAGKSNIQAYWGSTYSGGTKYYIDTGIGVNTTFVVDSVFQKETLLMTVYVNGIEVGSKTIVETVWNLDGQNVFLQMGANSGALNDSTGFRLFSVMLYDRCLTEEEIQYNYTIDLERFGI